MELHNIDKFAKEMIYKMKAVNLCSNSIGQIGVGLMVNPPNKSNASQSTIDLHNQELTNIYDGLKERAKLLTDRLNSMKNVSCTNLSGAMYAFPKINFPQYYIDQARKEKRQPDLKYCLDVLESTGIMIVPGSGFGQKEGTYHFRITNLISTTAEMKKSLDNLEKVTNKIMDGN